jgi:hypothetical protein
MRCHENIQVYQTKRILFLHGGSGLPVRYCWIDQWRALACGQEMWQGCVGGQLGRHIDLSALVCQLSYKKNKETVSSSVPEALPERSEEEEAATVAHPTTTRADASSSRPKGSRPKKASTRYTGDEWTQ